VVLLVLSVGVPLIRALGKCGIIDASQVRGGRLWSPR